MTFTESDAENDGLIKREVGKEMAKVAKTQNPQVFQHFQNVCEEVGREPAEVFGEMAVRALNSEEYARQVLGAEISMSQIKADEIRLEDVKYVKELSEELGLNQSEEQTDPIDELINQRLQSVTSSPLDNFKRNQENPQGANGQVLQHMESLQNEINRLEQKIDGDGQEQETSSETSETGEQSVDDLFGDSEGQDDGVEGDVVELSDSDNEPEPEDDAEEATEGEIEEALEGTDNTVEDAWEEDGDVLNEDNITIPDEDEEDDGFITSENGEEE